MAASPSSQRSTEPSQTALTTSATFVFEDCLKKPIKGLSIKITSDSNTYSGETDDHGLGVTLTDIEKNKELKIFIRKKSGRFELKGKVTPQNDINNYIIRSPEIHLSATTGLSPKEAEEAEIVIPTIGANECLTINRLLGELAPFIGAAEIITEQGKVLKDFPRKTAKTIDDEAAHKKRKIIEIEHHFKVIKITSPRTIAIDLLGSRLNYPTGLTISDALFDQMSRDLGCEAAALKAVAETETGGIAFFDNGLPKILFERHKFFALTKPQSGPHPFAKFPDICAPTPGGYGPTGTHQYERLVKAAALNREAALMACSWGAFQVLAEYFPQCGYRSAEEMANDCMKTVDAHAKLFVAFLKTEKRAAVKALKEKDWEKFTANYNGANWREQNPNYPTNMAANYEKYKK